MCFHVHLTDILKMFQMKLSSVRCLKDEVENIVISRKCLLMQYLLVVTEPNLMIDLFSQFYINIHGTDKRTRTVFRSRYFAKGLSQKCSLALIGKLHISGMT
jgi:hypothetical protein